MYQHARDLVTFRIAASDGELGTVDDLYFDDERWTVRYLVVNTGSWLTGRLVLVSPIAVRHIDREDRRIDVDLTREQVERSPSFDTHRPVSRQHESAYAAYYGYPVYWGGASLWGWAAYPAAIGLTSIERHAAEQATPDSPGVDSHLRSTTEIGGYAIVARDGEIGHLRDFVLDGQSWAIRLLIVDTSNWWVGKKVLIAPSWITEIRWADRTAHVALTREAVKSSPEWDKRAPIDEQYERQLAAHYGPPQRDAGSISGGRPG
jgi:hypothetical protein